MATGLKLVDTRRGSNDFVASFVEIRHQKSHDDLILRTDASKHAPALYTVGHLLTLYRWRNSLCRDMKNEASKTRSLDIAFVVTPDLLKRLAVILGETSDTLEYTAKFSDGTSVHYNKIEDVIGQTNSDKRSIVSLIAGTADETARSAYVNLKKNDSPSLEYTITGAQRDVIYFADQLDDWVAATRQWYSPFFSGQNNPSGAGIVLFIVAIFLPIYAWDHLSKLFLSDAFKKSNFGEWAQLMALVGMWVAEYFIFKLFPRGTFAIGQGERRHQFFVYLRRTVIFGTLLSVLVRALWTWFAKHP